MPVSFREHDIDFVVHVQKLYSKGLYTQKQLYEELKKSGYNVSMATVAKMCRCDPANVARVDQDVLEKATRKRGKIHALPRKRKAQ